MFAMFLMCGALAVEQPAPPMPIYADRVDRGFLFIDGEYLKPPYMVVQTQDALAVNGRVIRSLLDSRDAEQKYAGIELGSALEQHSVVVLNSWEPPINITSGTDVGRFLQMMTSDEKTIREQALQFDRNDTWKQWVQEFEAPQDFVRRANRRLQRMRKIRETTMSRFRNRQSVASMGYILTIVGMILGVWALGHLLSSSPRPDEISESKVTPAIIRATRISIIAVFMLSGLDLIWTLVVSNAGQMREVNPLGSRLIDNPMYLVAFKVTATLIGCGVLYAMRHHQRARKAAWWMCLVMTVLTFRWLVFNSMHFTG